MEYYETLKNSGIVLIGASLIAWTVFFVYWLYRQKQIQKHMLEIYGEECCVSLRRNTFQTQAPADRQKKRGKNSLFQTRRKKSEEGVERT